MSACTQTPSTDRDMASQNEEPTAWELEKFRQKHWTRWNADENLLIAHLVQKLKCAALSQSAPQGVAGMMHLVEKYASDTADFVLVGSPVSSCEPIEQAITAVITERDTLRERVAELEKDAARYRWLTEDHADAKTREACRELLYRMPVMSYAAASHAIDAAMAASREAP